MLQNTAERYGRVAQFFHWTTAILILSLLPMGLIMTWLPQGNEAEVAQKVWLYSLHKTLGVTVLALSVMRIVWALANPRPKPLHPERRLETLAAETVHWMLYGGIIITPLTGLLHHAATTGFAPIWWPFSQDIWFVPKDEGLSKLLGYAHIGAAIAIAASVGAHIAGALKHVVVDRDRTLTRMIAGEAAHFSPPDGPEMGHGLPSALAVFSLVGIVGATILWGQVGRPADTAVVELGQTESAGAHGWLVDHEESSLAITVDQLGNAVDGVFESWTAEIDFDPENPQDASVRVEIATGSLVIGTASSDATGSGFLDAANHPVAVFESSGFAPVGDGQFETTGDLTIKGTTRSFLLPFKLAIDGDTALMNASTVINRLDFNVGGEQTVGPDVDIVITLKASRSAASPGS